MIGLDGYEVTTRIRSAPVCGTTELIAMTGYGQNEHRAKAERRAFSATW
jgi:CheY-like chemotaxis protein